MAVSKHKAREYETIFIVDPTVDQSQVETITNKVSEVIAKMNGTLAAVDNWGRRKLAYRTDKKTRGHYMYLRYLGRGGLVAEVERNLRMVDSVFRFQTNLIAEDVDVNDAGIDKDKIVFRAVELAAEDPELTVEQRLGLAHRSGGHSRSSERRDDESSSEDYDSDYDDSDGDDAPEKKDLN